MRLLRNVVCALAAVLTAGAVSAQKFPERPVRLIIPYAAGGSFDVIARALGQKFQEQTGQPLVADNRGGAAGLIASDLVAKAPPDGYTLLLAAAAQVSIAAALHEKMSYDPLNDLVPITYALDTSNVLFVGSAFPAQSVQDLVAMARAKPGAVTYGSSGNGSVTHLGSELFAQRLGLRLVHVAYRGAAPALTDVASGTVSLIFTTLASGKPLLAAGRIRALAIAAPRRSAAIPDVPTLSELGYKGVDSGVWVGVLGSKGLPDRIVNQLHAEFAKALASPDVIERMGGLGADIVAKGPAEFRAMIRDDTETWRRVVKAGNIKAE